MHLFPIQLDIERDDALYLGSWAVKDYEFDRRFDDRILPYHYDDRALLESDFDLASNYAPLILNVLYQALKDNLCVGWTYEQFEFYYLTWVLQFIQLFLDTSRSIDTMLLDKKISATYIADVSDRIFLEQSASINTIDENYIKMRFQLYTDILETRNLPKSLTKLEKVSLPTTAIAKETRSKWISKRIINRLLYKRDAKIVYSLRKFSFRSFGKLFFTQGVQFMYPLDLQITTRPNLPQREALSKQTSAADLDPGPALIAKLIPYYLPINLFEKLPIYQKQNARFSFFKHKKAIFTFSIWIDFFRYQLANNLTQTQVNLIQHGGHYGIAKWSTTEFVERQLSKHFITFGWKKNQNDIGIGSSFLTQNLTRKSAKKITLISNLTWTIFYKNWSCMLPGKNQLDYLNQIMSFYAAVETPYEKPLQFKLYPKDTEKKYNYLREKCPAVTILPRDSDYTTVLQDTRLAIHDCNQTTFLQTLALNIPTLIFWNPAYNELSDIAKTHIAALKKANIFFESGEDCALHLNNIYEDIETWWQDPERQAVIKAFTNSFAKKNPNYLEDYKKLAEDLG